MSTTSTPAASVPPQPWPAPRAGAPLRAEVTVPGSKSLTNRYLLLAALADGPSLVINPLHSRDSRLMLDALAALGCTVEHVPDWENSGVPAVRVTPLPAGAAMQGRREHAEELRIDCGLAGTVMRFMPGVAALTGARVHFDGDPEARARPMGAVQHGLRDLGVEITGPGAPEPGQEGHLPFTVHAPQGITGDQITIDASASSQFVSGLLLAAARMPHGLTLRHVGESVPSLEHVEMTLQVLTEVGVQVSSPAKHTWRVEPGEISAFSVRVEPDLSNAGPFLCAAAVTGGEVSMRGWPITSTQIGRRWTELLPAFGAEIVTEPETASTVTLRVRGAQLRTPGTVDGTAELTPTVAALAALCQEPTRFTSVGHLRGHETDRIAALVAEIRRLGGSAEETEDGFEVTAPVTHGGLVRSYADHRMATFGAVLGLVLEDVEVEDISCTAKTMPDFPQLWAGLLAPAPEAHP
ncbi:3-phosphoshikimate 1-carboxyvinyltransferase [Nesterenkonia sp. E16_7]|uniref:3-phosphoshikimate 1-carboxyvinyltransferase n=1 Tax=unclassified Nesterenkonia TaxID=2629769 RepID=UPI001A925015|nr:3-phosphoshikimate 1-carboxyvinyltransferase [Nesterenkonia sp. E16_10]MBO0598729.1 3-phosphoshikimate 1-carboxyvinyltransferase [Nesterenkonia sp. E16_7]